MDETNLSTKRAQTSENSWFPQTDVDQGRTGNNSFAPGEGTPTTVGVSARSRSGARSGPTVGPIRSRHTFEAVRRDSSHGRSGPLSVSFLPQITWSRAEVGYAINRRVGNAVVRNQLRRRLRAIMSEQAPSLPIGAYVVHTGPGAPSLGFDELKVAMSRALEKATDRSGSHPPVVERINRAASS
jgi:ribonuclease P protein component